MDKPAIDRKPGEPEVYYFDDTVREAVRARRKAIKEPAPVKKTAKATKASKKTTKKG